jgi:glycosyltransferase involved in cell wall biosynthesis
MPKVSVVMPVYNTKEEYLREAIESILNQTFTDFEFIIINDGSTNNAEDVILSYKDERIKYIKQEKQGIPKTRNKGLEMATGEYVAVFDSDDISLPERFEKQVKYLDENKNISVLGSWFEIFPKYAIIAHPKTPKICDFLKENCIAHPSVMLRKSDFDKYNLRYNEDFKVAQDYELWSRAVRVLNFENLQEVLLKYRRHENNNSKPSETLTKNNTQIKNNILNFLTTDENLKNKIKKFIIPQKPTFLQKIFSVRTKTSGNRKKIIVRILGIKISLKTCRSGK